MRDHLTRLSITRECLCRVGGLQGRRWFLWRPENRVTMGWEPLASVPEEDLVTHRALPI